MFLTFIASSILLIVAEHISKDYGRNIAVEDISFEVKAGENLVLLGTSGCGKTTTLKSINRLIELTSGRITVNGDDITTISPHLLRQRIGYVLQHNSLFPHYTVQENIAVVPQLLGWDKKKIRNRSQEMLLAMRLPENGLTCYPHELSGGQQQRVNIARALAADPPVLLMDEPFGALDAVTRAAITQDFASLEELKSKTIVLVTHDVQEAFTLADTICLMNKGKIMQIGAPQQLLFKPANEFVRNFLSSSYLRLAMGIVTIGDVWNEIHSQEMYDNNSLAATTSTSVWDVTEQAVKQQDVKIISVTNKEGITKHFDKEQLLSAFSRYQYK